MENNLEMAAVLKEVLEDNGINYNPIDDGVKFIQTILILEAKSLESALEMNPSVDKVAFYGGDSNTDPIVTVITRKADMNEISFIPAYMLDKDIKLIYNEDPVYLSNYKNIVRMDKFEQVANSIVSQILNRYIQSVNLQSFQSYYKLPGVMIVIRPLNKPYKLAIVPHPVYNLYANYNNDEYRNDYMMDDSIGEILRDLDFSLIDGDKIKISPLNNTNASLDYIRIDNKINDKDGINKMNIDTIAKLNEMYKDVNNDLEMAYEKDSYPIKPSNCSPRDRVINMTFNMMIDEILFDLEEAASNLEIGLNDIKGNLNINKLMWFREVYCILENLQSGNDDELKSYNDMVLIYCMYNNMDTVLNIKPEYGDDIFDHVYKNSLDILNDVMRMLSIEEELKFESI